MDLTKLSIEELFDLQNKLQIELESRLNTKIAEWWDPIKVGDTIEYIQSCKKHTAQVVEICMDWIMVRPKTANGSWSKKKDCVFKVHNPRKIS